MSIKILHTADLHLDSPFEGLSDECAALRRSEQRQLLRRLSELCRRERVDVVLLSGDLLDSTGAYYETGEELYSALAAMAVPVFIAPGNHDYYCPSSPYAKLKLPGNVCVFKNSRIEYVELPSLKLRVYGAGFTDKRCEPILEGFRAEPTEGFKQVMCIHGELTEGDSPYNPIKKAYLAESGLNYVALGHVHKASGLRREGECYYSWPGCPEGRGFDETGRKTVNIVTLEDDGSCTLVNHFVALRRCETLTVDITGAEPVLAIHNALPDDTEKDIYRITLVGETDTAPDLNALSESLKGYFFQLRLVDETRLRACVWERAGEDSLRGLFLLKLKQRLEKADDKERVLIEQAARWGLAALDNMEEAIRHEDK